MMYKKHEEALRRAEGALNNGHSGQDLDQGDMQELFSHLSGYYDDLNGQNQALRRVIQENVILRSRYQRLYEEAPAGYVIFRADGLIVEANKTFCQMVDLTPDVVHTHNIVDFFPSAQQTLLRQTYEEILQNDTRSSLELSPLPEYGPSDVLVLIDRFRQLVWNGHSLTDNGHYLLRCVINDISDIKRKQREIWQKSIHDPLTGVYNRLFYADQLPHLDQAQALPLSIVMLDIDRLKTINDTLGHGFGDEAIILTAQTLQKNARATDFVCRVGGDELVVLMPNTDLASARAYAETCRAELGQHALSGMNLGFSWGAATRLRLEDVLSTVIATAEDMMYTCKQEHAAAFQHSAIQSIMQSLFERNPQLHRHCVRVARMAKEFGRWLGSDPGECTFLWRLGLLHDIGMASISDEILNKDTVLTERERQELQRHPEIGARILRQNLRSAEFAQIVLYHHEDWQGGGYPAGCRSESLPFESRLLRVLDTYDRIRYGLSGGPLQEPAAAMEKLQELAGHSLDPALTKQFITFLKQREAMDSTGMIGAQASSCTLYQDPLLGFEELLDY